MSKPQAIAKFLQKYEKLFSLLLAALGIVAAIWTLCLLGKQIDVMIGQTKAMLAQNEASINSARLDQRAWIKVTTAAARITAGIPFAVDVRIENVGKTPARKVFGYIVPNLLAADEMPAFVYEPGYPRHVFRAGIIFAGERGQGGSYLVLPKTAKSPVDVKPFIPGLADVGAFVSQKTRVSVHGQVWYEDTFGVQHWVRFCQAGVIGGRADIALIGCSDYNTVDDNQEYPNTSQPFRPPPEHTPLPNLP